MKTVKVTVNLPESLMLRVRALALENGATVTSEMSSALVDHLFLAERRTEGSKILVRKSNGSISEVMWS